MKLIKQFISEGILLFLILLFSHLFSLFSSLNFAVGCFAVMIIIVLGHIRFVSYKRVISKLGTKSRSAKYSSSQIKENAIYII